MQNIVKGAEKLIVCVYASVLNCFRAAAGMCLHSVKMLISCQGNAVHATGQILYFVCFVVVFIHLRFELLLHSSVELFQRETVSFYNEMTLS